MRILQVTPLLSWRGGVQEYVASISKGLVAAGHEVRLVAVGGGAPPHPMAADLDIQWHPPTKVLGRYTLPAGLLRSIRNEMKWADMVHAHQPLFTGTLMAAALHDAPLALTLHLHAEHLIGARARSRRAAIAWSVRRAELVVAVSHAELDLITRVRTPNESCVIWPGVDERPMGPTASARSRPMVLAVGRLVESKRVEILIKAAAKLASEYDFVVVGDGPQREQLVELCGRLGLDHESILRGEVTDAELDDLVDRADVFISASTEEAFGIAALKALAGGAVLVLRDIPSFREISTQFGYGRTQLVREDAGPEQFENAVRQALAERSASRQRPAGIPTWAESAATLAADFERVIARHV